MTGERSKPGTPNRNPSKGQLAKEIESSGGDVNAYTSFENTVYHATCAESHWEKVIDCIKRVFNNMTLETIQNFCRYYGYCVGADDDDDEEE